MARGRRMQGVGEDAHAHLGAHLVVPIRGQRVQAQQVHHLDGVAARQGAIARGLGAHQQPLAVVGRDPVATRLVIEEARVEVALERARVRKPARIARGLEEVEQARLEEGVVVEQARAVGLLVAHVARQLPIGTRVLEQVGGGALGPLHVAGLSQHEAPAREGGDHEAVPGHELLVIQQGRLALGALLIELRADLFQRRRGSGGRHAVRRSQLFDREIAPQHVVGALEVGALSGQPVSRQRELRVFGTHDLSHLLGGPDEEDAFLPFAVRVGGGVEGSVRGGHLARHVVEHVARHRRVGLLARDLERLEIGDHEQRVVVEHLLEVRNGPGGLGRVAMEAAAQVVVDSAASHGVQGLGRHLQQLGVARTAVGA